MKKIGLLLFKDAEVLDFAGPFEVFSVAGELHPSLGIKVLTISENKGIIKAKNGLKIEPDTTIAECPDLDILIVPGGSGTREFVKNEPLMAWVYSRYKRTPLLLSICSAARIFAKLGFLDHASFCTHHLVAREITKLTRDGLHLPDRRFVKTSSRLYTAGGISAGIDLSLHVTEMLWGSEVRESVANYMEYSSPAY
ncbi:MAG: DJ-1/PfpI family protein [Balneolales bacterium]|nr:DJ-1/PfpI family protein [Balneolales bacterium]